MELELTKWNSPHVCYENKWSQVWCYWYSRSDATGIRQISRDKFTVYDCLYAMYTVNLILLNVLGPLFCALTLGLTGSIRMMRLAWKKSHKRLDTSKRLHQNKTRSTGRTWSQFIAIIGSADSGKCRCVKPEGTYGVWNVLAGGRLQPGLKLWSPPPPRPKEEVFKVFLT